jgi:hypothetical protein
VFGSAFSDDIHAGRAEPEFGKLECGCEPTLEKLADPLLTESVAFRLAMENLTHMLCLLVQPVLKRAFPTFKDFKGNEYSIPDFDSMQDLAHPATSDVLRNILAILGEARQGRNPLWHSDNVHDRCAWVQTLHSFITTHVPEWTDFLHFDDLRFLTRESFAAGDLDDGRYKHDMDLERWEKYVVVIWMYLLSRQGQFPPILPKGPRLPRWECADCRNAVLEKFDVLAAFDNDNDNDDGDMSEDKKKRQKNLEATRTNRKHLRAAHKAMVARNAAREAARKAAH